MAYLEKKILVTIPVTETHKTYLEKQASSGKYNCQFWYIPKEHVTKEDLEDTQVLIGNLPPALVREAEAPGMAPVKQRRSRSLYAGGSASCRSSPHERHWGLWPGGIRAYAGPNL